MRKPSAAMIVALVALFVALTGVGVAATGGNFILGKSNTASLSTSLSAPVAGGKALQVSNTNTSNAASTALGLTVAPGHAPFTVNSGGKVANLNADLLDGLDSSMLQRRVTGSCSPKSAMTGIGASGSVACSPASQVRVAADKFLKGPFPASGWAFSFTTQGGPLVVTFDGSAYSPYSEHLMQVELWICASAPCGVGNYVRAVNILGYTNEANSHRALITHQAMLSLPAGAWYAQIATETPGTIMDDSDWASVSILEL